MRHLRIITLLPGPSKYNPDADITGTTTNPGDSVQIRVNGTTYTVTSDSLGRFSFDIPSGVTPTNLYRFMYEQTNVETVDLTNLDTSSVTDFGDAFKGCTNLETVDTTGIDMGSVTSISNMFDGCSSLTGVTGIEDWDTSSLLYMGITFRNCTSLTSLDLSGWDTDQLTSVSSAFYGCIGLTSLDLSSWDTTGLMSSGNYTYFVPNTSSLTAYYDSSMFSSTITGTFGNVNWVDVNHLFQGTVDMTTPQSDFTFKVNQSTDVTVPVASDGSWYWDNGEGYTISNLYGCFSGKTLLKTVKIKGSALTNTSLTHLENMFYGCTSLVSADVRNLVKSKNNPGTNGFPQISNMFDGCSSLTSITGLGTWDMSSCVYASSLFNGCSSLTEVGLDGISDWNMEYVRSVSSMFKGTAITSLTLNWNLVRASTAKEMFSSCSRLTDLDLRSTAFTSLGSTLSTDYSDFCPDSSSLTIKYDSMDFVAKQLVDTFTNVNWVDYGALMCGTVDMTTPQSTLSLSICGQTVTVNVDEDGYWEWSNDEGINLDSYAYFTGMLENNTKIKTLKIGKAWTENGNTSISGMCEGCSNLVSFSTTRWASTKNCEYADDVFSGCSGMTSCSFESGCTFQNCDNFDYMFNGCSSLVTENLPYLSARPSYVRYMFNNCSSLTTLRIQNFILIDADVTGFIPNSSSLDVYCNSTRIPAAIRNQFPDVNWHY